MITTGINIKWTDWQKADDRPLEYSKGQSSSNASDTRYKLSSGKSIVTMRFSYYDCCPYGTIVNYERNGDNFAACLELLDQVYGLYKEYEEIFISIPTPDGKITKLEDLKSFLSR